MDRLLHLSPSPSMPPPAVDLLSPFGDLDGLDRSDFCEAAYEVFFAACRSTPGFGGRTAILYHSNSDGEGNGSSPVKRPGVGMAVTSRIKNALGLRMMKRSMHSRRASSCGSNPSSPSGSSPRLGSTVPGRMRRPKTSAEIMRQQMRVTEQSDNRLRKTLMRTLVGQMGRRAETIILPLELLRHLKPSEFSDPQEYHLWQKRQLKIIEAGLLLHPSIPLEKSDTFAAKLRDIINGCDSSALDTSKNSDTMRTLCNCIVSLAWRSPDGGTTDVCHWADGYPLNVHIYTALLSSIFDMKEETLVLDEVDELLELMKKTWSTLGINRSVHNLCFAWVLFEQYVLTEQAASEGALDLLGASLAMLTEVANDAKRADREPTYVKMLAGVLVSMKRWCEKRLLDYHGSFSRATIGVMENMLPLLFSATKILEEDVPRYVAPTQEKGEMGNESSGNRVDHYIRSSVRNAFAKMLEDQNVNGKQYTEALEVSELLINLAKKTEELASKEKELFRPVLKKWHPVAAGVAAVTLHTCYGTLLKQYIMGKSSFLNEIVLVLQRAGKLEKSLVQLVVEDSVECEDGGKAIVREMVPYEAESMILRLQKQWLEERMIKGKEHLLIAKQTETWNPTSKTEPYAHSAVELVDFAKEAMENFFEIQVNVSDSLFYDFVDGLENIFRDYIMFVASCGSKQSYLPTLPSLTRCSRDSKISKFWRITCSVGVHDPTHVAAINESNNPRPSTSRGTQRLYIRLNTLHYLVSQLNSLDKTLSLSPKSPPSKATNRRQPGGSYFENSLSILQAVSHHVIEVSAYRLIFHDSNSVFHDSLYAGGVANARIKPAIRLLKQNLTLLCAIVTERAQPMALKEVMRASFQAFLMVLLAGGSKRMFTRLDHSMIEEDLESLKRVFCACGEGLIVEDMVEKESEAVEGVVALMAQPTEQLIEDLISSVAGTGSCMGSGGHKISMPPTTGKWERSDPNTILRVLCCRNDRAASYFLKKTFHLSKRRAVA